MALVKFRDLGVASQKLQTNGKNSSKTYATNAKAAAGDWHAATSASGENWSKAVREASDNNRFIAGVNKAGATAYSSAIDLVGQNRFEDGISKAGPKWNKGFGEIAASVAGTDIGPRGITGSSENKQRSAAMQDAFRAARMRRLGAA